MSTEWIDAVMQINGFVIEAETRLDKQVSKVLTMVLQGKNTIQDEGLVTSYGDTLVALRDLQKQLLTKPAPQE